MSVEFNAENRNAGNVRNVRNINTIRCCSFCRRTGHNISTCNSLPIIIFERETIVFIQIMISSQNEILLENLRNHLLIKSIEDANLVKAFAISRCRANTRTNIITCIDLIVQYFTTYGVSYFLMESQRRINMSMYENSIVLDTKFHIKTQLSKNQYNLEEKCECNICYEELEKKIFIKLDCGHEFCKDCIKKTLQNETRRTPCCAFCRADIKNLELKQASIKIEFNELIRS